MDAILGPLHFWLKNARHRVPRGAIAKRTGTLMKTTLLGPLIFLSAAAVFGADKVEKETTLAQSVTELRIVNGIIDVHNDTNSGQITVYIGGRGSATANLVNISKVKAEDHALRIAESAANNAFAAFIKKNIDAVLEAEETITDSSLDIEDLVKKMNQVTENKTLAGALRPEDRAQIIKAILDRTIESIKKSTGVQSISTLRVRQSAMQNIRGMTLFGANKGFDGNEIVAVKVYKWSPNSATFAATAEGYNNQNAISPGKGAEKLTGRNGPQAKKGPFISNADDF
jgi:hypothetical protein